VKAFFKILATGAAVAISSLIFTPSASAQADEQGNCGCNVSSNQVEYQTMPFRHQVKVKRVEWETVQVPVVDEFTTYEWQTKTVRYQVEVRPVEVCGCGSTRPAEYEWRTKEVRDLVPVKHAETHMVPKRVPHEIEETEWRTDDVRVPVRLIKASL
jgi:hypothetical protein